MKFNNVIQVFILVLFSAFAQAEIKSIEPQTVLKLIEDKQAPLIVDVRTPKEFFQGHIPGAINIPYDSQLIDQQLDAYKDLDMIVYCRTGRRAQVATGRLQKKGFKKLIDLDGHMIKWQQLHYPLALF